MDLESRITEQHHQSLRLWLRLLACTVMIEDQVRSKLRQEFATTLPRFDLMAQLERHPEGLRMGELSRRMMVTGGNITSITDQLEQEELVQRVADSKDRRAYSVRLTAAGRRAFKRMAAVHEEWIVDLMAPLDAAQKQSMFDALGLIKQAMQDSESHENEE